MNQLTSIVYTVSDLAAATALHTALLGVPPHTETPYYVGFAVGGLDLALTPADPASGVTGGIAYVGVPDLEAAVAQVVAAGAVLVTAPHDVGGGTRIATVADADGTVLGLIHR